MFILDEVLKEKVCSAICDGIEFCSVCDMTIEGDCSCKGGCGTYTPPCSCCAYN